MPVRRFFPFFTIFLSCSYLLSTVLIGFEASALYVLSTKPMEVFAITGGCGLAVRIAYFAALAQARYSNFSRLAQLRMGWRWSQM